jgi:DNA invertase Pin-like site-specific DNA recombinase
MSHETIYRSLFVQTRGVLKKELLSHLRSKRSRGLGLDAQRQAVATYLNGGDWQIVAEFTEVESGKRVDRPQLDQALAAARLHRCPVIS